MTSLSNSRGFSMNSSTAAEPENNGLCRLSRDFDLLRHTSLFAGLNLDVVKLFAYLSNHRTYHPDDRLIEQGKKSQKAFILIDGTVEISVNHKGKEVTLQLLKDEGFFGELALLAQFDWFFTVRAVTDVEILSIDRAAFQKVIEKFPQHKDQLIERLIKLRVDRLANKTSFLLDRLLAAEDQLAASQI